jgi:DNA-binding GntR family transcriptional regulator
MYPPPLRGPPYQRLRIDVLTGQWKPRHKLLMHELRQRYGLGASPLREALNRPASEGLVVHNEQRGFTVAQATAEQLRDLVQTRLALESMALTRAFAHRTTDCEEDLLLAFHRLSRAQRSIDPDSFEDNPEWERLHRAFHTSLLKACESATLQGFCGELYDKAYRFRQLAARKAYRRRNELEEHRALLNCVMENRLQDAIALLTEHYRLTAEIIEENG